VEHVAENITWWAVDQQHEQLHARINASDKSFQTVLNNICKDWICQGGQHADIAQAG
jgi:hypothetical protein